MSGIEIAGLVLGAIPVAQASYATIGNFFCAWRGAGSQVLRLQKLHKIEANMFRVSIRVLFSGLLDKRTVTDMLDQSEHRLWRDKKIQEQLGSICSEDPDVSEAINANIELAKKALLEIEDVFRRVEERAKVANEAKPKEDRPNRLAKVVLSHLQQSSWALSKKAKIESLLNDINRNNNTLYKFANEIRRNRKKPAYKASPLVPFERVSGLHTLHTHLYHALTSASGKCACSRHRVDLALDYMPTARPNSLLDDPNSDFKVAFYVYPSNNCSACWHIDLTYFETNVKNPLKRKISDDQNDPESPRTRRSTTSEGHSFTEEPGLSDESEGKKNEPDLSPVLHVPKNESLEAQFIDDLCSALHQLDWSKGESEESQRTLGYLLYQKMHAYEVHVSDSSTEVGRSSDSLDRILSNTTSDDYIKTQVMYPYQRLRLAYVLSLSLLRLYPSPWLDVKDRWASNNVRFFLTQLSPEKCVVTPHIMGPSQSEKARSGTVRGLVKNYQIYALGVLLLEIAIGKSIDTSVIPGEYDHETREFLAALKFDKDGIVAQALGCRYADIVSRCLLFKFDGVESDLRREELQRAFYEDVVCQLEDCVRELSSQGAGAR